MFEARLAQSSVLKKLIESIKDLVNSANVVVDGSGIVLQAMDSSHVALVSFLLDKEGFDSFRADRNITLGINLKSLSTILKCAGNDDVVTLKADDSGDSLTLVFENEESNKICDFELKLMDIDVENLAIPDIEYGCLLNMPSSEFQRICRDLLVLGDTVTLNATKEGVKFSTSGGLADGNITLSAYTSVDKPEENVTIKIGDTELNLAFALKYLNNFTKATCLAPQVTIGMDIGVPLIVRYEMENLGYLSFYLAPKMDEEEEQE